MAKERGGDFLLRIEDIDQTRSRPEWEEQIYDDLSWLGITWKDPVLRQSDRLPAYREALTDLWNRGLIYPCTCTRKDIIEAASAPNEGEPPTGPDGVIYPGTCRPDEPEAPASPLPGDLALRLNMARAAHWPKVSGFHEAGLGPNGETGQIAFSARMLIDGVGDIVLARRDMGTSYHLAVVLDDAMQGITDVVRGQDLFEATKIHVVLQRLLGLLTPVYHHHRLIRDEAGKRLAKRDDARAIRQYRKEGATPADIRRMVGL
jgi:glutamyl-Q tRNA(Asp) synthetase